MKKLIKKEMQQQNNSVKYKPPISIQTPQNNANRMRLYKIKIPKLESILFNCARDLLNTIN